MSGRITDTGLNSGVMGRQTAPRGPGSLCYVASGPLPAESANAVNVACMSAAFQSKGFEVAIAAPARRLTEAFRDNALENYVEEGGPGVPVSRLWFPSVRGGGTVYRTGLRARLRFRRPDFVYGRMLAGCRVAAGMRIATAYEAHMPVWEHDTVKRRLFEAMTAEASFSGIVVISRALKEVLLESYPELEDRVTVSHDAASHGPRPVFRAPDDSGPVQVLYTGSLYAGKGMELLTRLAPRCPWARFSILGGTEGDIRKWRDRSAEVADNIEFLGRRPHSQVREYMSVADILVAPYQAAVSARGERRDIARWMSPLKIFEYMAANRPMVVSDLPVLREVLSDERNALLVNPDDVDAWVEALGRLRRDAALAERLAATARADFERKHTWEARAEQVLSHLGWERSPLSTTTPQR